MSNKSKKLISGGMVLGKKVLSVAESVLLELIEQYDDMVYMRSHCYAVLGHNVREARHESEEGERLHEIKMKRQAIQRLVEQKFIKLRKEGERIIYELTANGKIKVIKIVIIHCLDCYIDGRLCLVSFDFPEAARESRAVFRRFLKNVGFKFVQGSVWSTKKNVCPEMKTLVLLLKINRWVEVFEAIR